MKVSSNLYQGGIAALYLLWLSCWLVLGAQAFGSNFYHWDQALVAGLAAWVAFAASRHTVRPYALFMAIKGAGLLMLALSWVTYVPDEGKAFFPFDQFGPTGFSDIIYGGCIFSWVCAWGYLAMELWRHHIPSAQTKALFSLLFIGIALILVNFYYPEYGSKFDTKEGRLYTVISGLEFLALLMGLVCILLKGSFVINRMFLAVALIIASDMGYSRTDAAVGIEPVWMFGQLLLLSSCLRLAGSEGEKAEEASDPSLQTERGKGFRSDLSGILLLLSLGGLLMAVALGLLDIPPMWKSFCAVLFVVILVVIEVWLTDHFDESVGYLKGYTRRLHQSRLEIQDWRFEKRSISATLQSTGLGGYLDALNQSANQLRRNVIFLGPERLYPEVARSAEQGSISCFLVMPFSLEWSDEVHRILSRICKSLDVRPMRGDDVFKPSDILVDIWQSINVADFVIADISGRNPNVLYELGIAHTLAKPVLILSKNADDIPIDLSTRRVIIYGQHGDRWQADLEEKVRLAIEEIIQVYFLKG